jgi:hypothetical protein
MTTSGSLRPMPACARRRRPCSWVTSASMTSPRWWSSFVRSVSQATRSKSTCRRTSQPTELAAMLRPPAPAKRSTTAGPVTSDLSRVRARARALCSCRGSLGRPSDGDSVGRPLRRAQTCEPSGRSTPRPVGRRSLSVARFREEKGLSLVAHPLETRAGGSDDHEPVFLRRPVLLWPVCPRVGWSLVRADDLAEPRPLLHARHHRSRLARQESLRSPQVDSGGSASGPGNGDE